MSSISKKSGNKQVVFIFSCNFMKIWKDRFNKIIVEGALEGCGFFSFHHLAELPYVVCILYVFEMYLYVPACIILKPVTLWSVSAGDSTEE